MSAIARPSTVSNRGATLVMIWAHQADEPQNILYAGTQNGYFFCWRQRDRVFEENFVLQMTDPGKITAMAFDSTNNRLCLCSRTDVVQSWGISKDPPTSKWIATNIFTRRFPKLVPQAIMFAAFDNSQDCNIMLHDPCGDAAFNWRDGGFCLDDPTSGPILFCVSDQMKAKMYAIHRERTYGRTRRVRFGENGSNIICGSNHGCVYVFDTWSGEKLQTLGVGALEWVQVIVTTEIGGVSVIFAAQTCALDFSEETLVWTRSRWDMSIGWSKMFEAVKVLIFLGCIVFLYQNLEARIRVLHKAMNM
ncbi:hypothetical protein B0H17DRAFT_1142563 [Mycena rosella]|uniref:WD40 repeat-like protein n=1 Tax=Mycena rosella TaxID=1033263 RepID=A0AAD7CXI8_MYCRO|nr:hypothetical protein B0H17DRAFT_1142563 [Mycena rosella]